MGQMNAFNKDDVQAELRAVIAEAHGNQTLHTIDWANMQLRRCVFSCQLNMMSCCSICCGLWCQLGNFEGT